MSDRIMCPNCNAEVSIEDNELFQVYESDGCQTEFDCIECAAPLIITSAATAWDFETEINE